MNLDLNANEATVTRILGELNLTDNLSGSEPVFLVGNKSGLDPKIYSFEQTVNLLDSGDYTEEYMENDFSDFNQLIQWVDQTRND